MVRFGLTQYQRMTMSKFSRDQANPYETEDLAGNGEANPRFGTNQP